MTEHFHSGGEPGSLPRFTVAIDGDEKVLNIHYLRRAGSPLIYTPMRSDTLKDRSYVPMSGVELVGPNVGEWERVTRSEQAEGGKCFRLVEVTLP